MAEPKMQFSAVDAFLSIFDRENQEQKRFQAEANAMKNAILQKEIAVDPNLLTPDFDQKRGQTEGRFDAYKKGIELAMRKK